MTAHCIDKKSAGVALLVYLACVFSLTLAPQGPSFFGWYEVPDLRVFEPFDFLENLIGFLPVGILLFFWLEPNPIRRPSKLAIAACGSFFVSLTIETVQAFMPGRSTQLADVLANVIGGSLGYGIARFAVSREKFFGWFGKHSRRLIAGTIILYVVFLSGYVLSTANADRLDEWNQDYHFAIGNEVTLDRPWLGRIFSVSLYDHALSAEEISVAFQAGHQGDNGVLAKLAPIASYCFCEGQDTVVYDRAQLAPPVNLEMIDQNAFWHPDGGLALKAPTILRTRERSTKIYEQFVASGSFSLATWIAPADVQQRGPARIISLSIDPFARNFTLGQSRSEISFRVRNHIAGANGLKSNLTTRGLNLTPTLTHLVAVYDRGHEYLYMDGHKMHTTIVRGGLLGIVNDIGFDVDSPWQVGWVTILLIGPVGVLAYWLVRQRNWHL